MESQMTVFSLTLGHSVNDCYNYILFTTVCKSSVQSAENIRQILNTIKWFKVWMLSNLNAHFVTCLMN